MQIFWSLTAIASLFAIVFIVELIRPAVRLLAIPASCGLLRRAPH